MYSGLWFNFMKGLSRGLSRCSQTVASLHPDMLKDNIHDAQQRSGCMDWAKRIANQFQFLSCLCTGLDESRLSFLLQ